jgi:alkaline phosphatase D
VQIILLDGRYHRSKLKPGFKGGEPGDGYRGKYVPNTDEGATMLGDAQWRWLEQQLKAPAEVRLIGSGIQVVPDEHGSETWGNFPDERKRLFKLIRDTKANGVVFLSGDRHLAEISRLPSEHAVGVGYPLFDITSSSLNAPSGNMNKASVRFANEINSYRVGLTYFDVNFGCIHVDWNEMVSGRHTLRISVPQVSDFCAPFRHCFGGHLVLDRRLNQKQDTFANLGCETAPSLCNFDEILAGESR